MSVSLKQQIIQRLQQVEDEGLLRELLQILEVEKHSAETYDLTEAEKKAVQEGLEDYKAGKAYRDEEANQKLRDWLKK